MQDEEFCRKDEWYKYEDTDQIWWLDNGYRVKGEHIFSFDRKTEFNLFADYPYKLSEEQKRIFDEENPFWADFFKNRRMDDPPFFYDEEEE